MLTGPLWKYASAGLLFVCIMLGIGLAMERRHSAKLQGQVVKLVAELKRISTAKDEQQIVTRDRIVTVREKEKSAGKVAERIEAAPLPGKCETPREIMGADL